ncbi:MAG: RDD family protein [Acidobacteria bacterium]|nr:RDD family protein [Acidobacteriota bacterium]
MPFVDLDLDDGAAPAGPGARRGRDSGEPDNRPFAPELPLFGGALRSDRPLITMPAAPRAPLAVRKPTPDMARARPRVRAVRAEPALDLEPALVEPRPDEDVDARHDLESTAPAASAGARLGGAAIDGTLLAAIDAAVIYLTLRLCGLSIAEIDSLPVAPLAGFFLVVNGGYFTGFLTSGGQTVGKMIVGSRVVACDGGRVTLGSAIVRTGAYLVSALPAALGFLPILIGSDRRALHDRIASTRVVKA